MKNSWLSFTIPDKLRGNLSSICQSIASRTNFQPMTYENIHMTAIFLGRVCLQVRIEEEHVLDIVSRHDLRGNFRFDRLEYFPPGKSNLIVAIFKTDNQEEIVAKLGRIKHELNDELGYDISLSAEVQSSNNNDFVPHFTLGKLKLTKSDLDELLNDDGFLSEINDEIMNKDTGLKLKEDHPLYLCGGS